MGASRQVTSVQVFRHEPSIAGHERRRFDHNDGEPLHQVSEVLPVHQPLLSDGGARRQLASVEGGAGQVAVRERRPHVGGNRLKEAFRHGQPEAGFDPVLRHLAFPSHGS